MAVVHHFGSVNLLIPRISPLSRSLGFLSFHCVFNHQLKKLLFLQLGDSKIMSPPVVYATNRYLYIYTDTDKSYVYVYIQMYMCDKANYAYPFANSKKKTTYIFMFIYQSVLNIYVLHPTYPWFIFHLAYLKVQSPRAW